MTRECFQEQVKELSANWPGKLHPPFLQRLWMVVSAHSDEDFTEAVNQLIFGAGPCPSGEKIVQAVETAKLRRAQARSYGQAGFLTVMQEAERNNQNADPEFVAECMKLLRGYLTGKVTKAQFDEGCGLLDEVVKINARAKR